MKTICMITISSYPHDPRIRREVEELEKNGYEIDIISISFENQKKIEKYGNITAYRVAEYLPGREEMVQYLVYSFLYMIKSFFKLQQLHKKRKYSLIQIHNMPDYLIFVAFIQKLLKVPLILDIHDLTLELFEEKWPGLKYKFIKRIIKKIEKISCSFADHIITVTEGCKEKLVQRGISPDKITLILNTANIKIFKFSTRSEYQIINKNAKLIYHGTVAKRFGIHLIIDAMKFVIEKIPGSVVNIYGRYDSNYKSYLNERIDVLGLSENVKLNGVLDRDEVPDVIRNSDIGVVPYLNNPYMHLALPTKACEFAAIGIPIVSTYLHTMALTFGSDSISFVNSENPEEFAARIIELCLNPELRKLRVDEAYQDVSEISWEVMGKRYTELINRLTNYN